MEKLKIQPRSAKVLEWGKLITITGGAQAIVQLTSLISGILIIRFLPTKEYAFYTLVNTMLGTMTVLADGGISTGVMALGGTVWQDKEKLGIVLATGYDLRKKFATVALLIACPILIYLLWYHGANFLTCFLIVLSLIPAFYAALTDSLLEVAPKLRQDITALQKNQISANTGRLVLTSLALLAFPWAFVAVTAAGIPRIFANFRLRKISANYANWNQKPDEAVEAKILSIVKRTLPGAIYYCVYNQITIWLLSIFGSTSAIAEVGALSRLTMVLTLCTTVFSTVVIPRFARLPDVRKLLLSKFLKIQLLSVLTGISITVLVMLFPYQVLSILGKNYHHLSFELVLITAGGCLTMISSITYSASAARGWILPPVILIAGNLAAQSVLIYFLDLTSVKNVLLFTIVTSFAAYLMMLTYFLYKVIKSSKAEI